MSLLTTFSDKENHLLQVFIEKVIKEEKILNEIQKLLFDQHFYGRFLKSNNFDVDQATQQFKNYIDWRKKQNIDTILDFEFQQYDKIKALFPNGFHSVDKQGRPILILQVGQIKYLELFEALHNSTDLLVHYFVKELEHTWRVKFPDSKEFVNKNGVDQIVAIIDMKGSKLKDITNKQMLQVFKQIVLEVQRFFPEMLHKLFVLNAPMFFENVWETQLRQSITHPEYFDSKLVISNSHTSDVLSDMVDEYELPEIYGGQCNCKATCVYSEKGPWSEVENLINYKNPVPDSDEEDDLDENSNKKAKMMMAFNNMNMQEEFKMMEGEEDCVDLLNEKKNSKNIDEFYANEEGLEDLKNQIRINMPGLKSNCMPSVGQAPTNNNTEAGDTESSEEQAFRIQQMKTMFNQQHVINFPGLTSQAKNKFNQ